MAEGGVAVELSWYAQRVQSLYTPLHGPPVGYTVAVADASECRRVVLRVVRVAGVLHYDRAGPRQVVPAECCRAVGTEPRSHPRTRAAAPERVALCRHAQLIRIGKDEADGPGQILTGSLCAGPVYECEGILTAFAQLERVREAEKRVNFNGGLGQSLYVLALEMKEEQIKWQKLSS